MNGFLSIIQFTIILSQKKNKHHSQHKFTQTVNVWCGEKEYKRKILENWRLERPAAWLMRLDYLSVLEERKKQRGRLGLGFWRGTW